MIGLAQRLSVWTVMLILCNKAQVTLALCNEACTKHNLLGDLRALHPGFLGLSEIVPDAILG